MRKLLTILAFTIAFPLEARDESQSYISYDDGGAIVREDKTLDIEARQNLPIFANDAIITSGSGRAEVRLSDGNVIGIDRDTSISFFSILGSREGHAEKTILELRSGKVMFYRAHDAGEATLPVNDWFHWACIYTASAWYCASGEAVFSLEADVKGGDRVEVFDGRIEVRKLCPATRMSAGERAQVDRSGIHALTSDNRERLDDFEHWFLRRPWRFGRPNSYHLGPSLVHFDDDLARYGSWVEVPGYGQAWRPSAVSDDWRPYLYGSWRHSRYGNLTWVSDEPWGWAPYHYGRWAHHPSYGWFWMPGTRYSPAWVYWWYEPSYIGWAAAGWYDCERIPAVTFVSETNLYAAIDGLDFGFGPYVRIRAYEIDLFPWTFVDAKALLSPRVDRAAMTTDVMRGLLQRDRDRFATIGTKPERFSRAEVQDPATFAAIARRSSLRDVTPFFRRDPE